MKMLGGAATFGQLNLNMDFSQWRTKTPDASIRRIVQTSDYFFKIQPGLWALTEYRDEILKRLGFKMGDPQSEHKFTHAYYQGLILEIGNLRNKQTFVPNQDKNKAFMGRALGEVSSLIEIHKFTHEDIVKFARTVDAIWFNERKMPCDFFEIEHTTDMKNSLLKFLELQDFNSNFFIIAPGYKRNKFDQEISRSSFKQIQGRVRFVEYEDLAKLHTQEYAKLRCI